MAILIAALLPGEPTAGVRWADVLCVLCGRAALADSLANVALFFPLGIALGWLGVPARRAILLAAGLSLAVETAQFWIPGRDPSLSDFLFNTLGAGVGIGLARSAPRWASPGVREAGRLSLLAGVTVGAVFVVTGVLLSVSLPETAYFGGSAYLQPSDRPLRIGGNSEPSRYFQGRIDEVRVYGRALTAAEIRDDMNTPVAAAPRASELVAAYDFDAGAESATDVAGQGNTGQILGATWTSQGKFRGALAFDGVRDVVVIPHSASLDLGAAMTLEAWIYPTAAQRGWRSILQKEFDTYFLFASSKAGPLRPGGGGTFGAATETLAAPAVVPLHTWTHVALTYDGAVLQLYVNGSPASRRLRWYPGRIVEATLDGLRIPAGISAESPQLRARLLAGAPLRVRAVAAVPVPTRAPLALLHDASRNEMVVLAAEGDDLVFRLRTRAAAAELDSPALRAREAMRGVVPGSDLTVTVSRPGRGYCVDVNGRSTCGLRYTLGMGWTFFLYSQVPPGWPHLALNALWITGLLLPFGFWLRRRWESLLGAMFLCAGALLACTFGNLGITPMEVGAGIVGIVAGWGFAALREWLGSSGDGSARGPLAPRSLT